MRVADIIINNLQNKGVECVFGISAGTVSSLYDAINDSCIKAITTKNEAGATYAASRYASISNKLGVCILAGGVGLNNAINGIADANRSKVPVLIISGCVNRWQIGKGAIQELNTEDILKPITKYSKRILDEKIIVKELNNAIKLALTPPYGPVHISIPIDIQIKQLELEEKVNLLMAEAEAELAATYLEYELSSVDMAIDMINKEEKGLILVGRGCRNIGKTVEELSKHLDWPVVTTPEGKGIISKDFHLNLGNYGFSSTDAAIDYVENSDYSCVLVLGSSLGESATRNYNDILFKNRKLIHVDWDGKELSKVFKADVNVNCSLEIAVDKFLKKTQPKKNNFERPESLNGEYIKDHTGLSLRLFLESIVNIVPSDTFFVSDIGEYMNFVFKYLPIKEGMGFDISLNYGAMGTGVCGALGASLALPNRQIAVLVGDGSFFMNGMEILTAKNYKLPIIYFVINNAMLGYVEHGHRYLYGRTLENAFVHERISISDMGTAMGIKSMKIEKIEEMENIKPFISKADGPCIIELITDGSEKVTVADRFKALNNLK